MFRRSHFEVEHKIVNECMYKENVNNDKSTSDSKYDYSQPFGRKDC